MYCKQTTLPARAALVACLGAIAAAPLHAAIDTVFNAGDLILGVQSSAATASVLEVNLGAPILYKNGSSSPFLVGNISLQLTNLFGNTWYENPNLFLGVSGANN